MELYNKFFDISDFKTDRPIGIYSLNKEQRKGRKCGCGGICDNIPEFVINYGIKIGWTFSCIEHARDKSQTII